VRAIALQFVYSVRRLAHWHNSPCHHHPGRRPV